MNNNARYAYRDITNTIGTKLRSEWDYPISSKFNPSSKYEDGKGHFIAIEGVSASGKETQLGPLRRWVNRNRHICFSTCGDYSNWTPQPAQYAYSEIFSNTKYMKRFYFTTHFFCGFYEYRKGGIPTENIDQPIIDFHKPLDLYTPPEMIILLDIDPDIARLRMLKEEKDNRYTMVKRDLDLEKKDRESYLKIAKANPDRWFIVNADQPISYVAYDVCSAMEKYFHDDLIAHRYRKYTIS